MAVVIDDHLLLGVVAVLPSEAIAEEMQADVVYTTGCWYTALREPSKLVLGPGHWPGALARSALRSGSAR